MITSISTATTSPIARLNAMNAFKTVQKPVQEMEQVANVNENRAVGLDNGILSGQNIEEIQKFAKMVGEDNLSVDDIKYGMTFQQSVIADYLV